MTCICSCLLAVLRKVLSQQLVACWPFCAVFFLLPQTMTAYRTNNSLSVGFQDRNSQPDAIVSTKSSVPSPPPCVANSAPWLPACLRDCFFNSRSQLGPVSRPSWRRQTAKLSPASMWIYETCFQSTVFRLSRHITAHLEKQRTLTTLFCAFFFSLPL